MDSAISENENTTTNHSQMAPDTTTFYVPKMIECMFYTIVKKREISDNGWARCMSTTKNYKNVITDNEAGNDNLTHFVMVSRKANAVTLEADNDTIFMTKTNGKKNDDKKERFEEQKGIVIYNIADIML